MEPLADSEPQGRHGARDERSPFAPLLLMALTLVGWFTFQAVQLAREQTALSNAFASQTRTVEDARKLRDSLDAIARETQLLADQGNPNARLIVEELRKRGVTINTQTAPAK